jgi:hypothetical protein
MQTMPRVKQASKQKRTIKAAAVTVLGATGLGFSLLGNASASTMPAAEIAQSDNIPPNQRFVLSEEEMADVSLATFHLSECELIRDRTTEREKRALFAELAEQFKILRSEIERSQAAAD